MSEYILEKRKLELTVDECIPEYRMETRRNTR